MDPWISQYDRPTHEWVAIVDSLDPLTTCLVCRLNQVTKEGCWGNHYGSNPLDESMTKKMIGCYDHHHHHYYIDSVSVQCDDSSNDDGSVAVECDDGNGSYVVAVVTVAVVASNDEDDSQGIVGIVLVEEEMFLDTVVDTHWKQKATTMSDNSLL